MNSVGVRRMEWQDYADELIDVLDLEGSPVAVTYSMRAPSGAVEGRHRVCKALLAARGGEVIDLTAESSSCPGGTWHLGLGEAPTGERARGFKEFLVDGEKLFCSISTLHRAHDLAVDPPLGLAEHVVLSPLGQAEFEPDAVVFICSAEQACRVVTLDEYETGKPPRTEMIGATCQQVITYPVVKGELNVSLMDYTTRHIRGYRPGDCVVTVPYHRIHGVMRSVPHCTAGRAEAEVPESFQDELDEGAQEELGL